MNLKEVLFYAYAAIGLGYVFYEFFGNFSLDPTKHPYNKLFDNRVFIKHFAGSIVLAVASVPIMKAYDNRAALLIAPMTFLLVLRVLNALLKGSLGRNIMLATRHDSSSAKIKIVDRISGFIILTSSFIIPGLIMNYFRAE